MSLRLSSSTFSLSMRWQNLARRWATFTSWSFRDQLGGSHRRRPQPAYRSPLDFDRLEAREAPSDTLSVLLGQLAAAPLLAEVWGEGGLTDNLGPGNGLAFPRTDRSATYTDFDTDAIRIGPAHSEQPAHPHPLTEWLADEAAPASKDHVADEWSGPWWQLSVETAGTLDLSHILFANEASQSHEDINESTANAGSIASAAELGSASPQASESDGASHVDSAAAQGPSTPTSEPLTPALGLSPNANSSLPGLTITPADADRDGIARDVEARGPNNGDGNFDGIADAAQPDVAAVASAMNREYVVIDGGGHALSRVQSLAPPAVEHRDLSPSPRLPLGLFAFNVNNVTPGGAATVRMFLPESSHANTYFKQNPTTGALERFDFDGTTGAEINGNVVTLHFVDGGRGDADGVANGVIVDPGGPGDLPIPYVRLAALDPSSAKYRIDNVHGTSTGAFVVDRGGDLTYALNVTYTVTPSSTAVAGQDYQALTGSVTIQPGQASAGIYIRPFDNATSNSSKSVGITLAPSPDYVVGTTGTPWVSISETVNDHPTMIEFSGDRPSIGLSTLDANAAELPGETSTGLALVYRSSIIVEDPMGPPGGGGGGGNGMTYTNPTAVTAGYTVGGTAASSVDYTALSGSASLPYAVYASELKVTPIDDSTLEGAETAVISLTPNASYYVESPTATVTIQDNEEIPVAPQANADEYAMGAEDGSLTIAAAGVLRNDYAFSPGPVTAVLKVNPTSGSVVLNSDGSFTYTPGAGIASSGGNDSFQYVAAQNGFQSNWAVVTIQVVKVTLTTPGLPHDQNMTTGAFVPINANNNNGSTVTNEIPAIRDFNTDASNHEVFFDPDLIKVDVNVNPNVGLPGFFTISVANNAMGIIRLWRDQWKSQGRAEGVYTQATLPQSFYMEGKEPSNVIRGSVLTLQYQFVGGGNGLQIAAGSDSLAATVTPVVNIFDITTQRANGVAFVSRPDPDFAGVSINIGMTTVGLNNNLAAVFDAQVTRKSVNGTLAFIVNANVPSGPAGVVNGVAGGPANGWTFTAGSGRAALNSTLVNPTTGAAVRDVLDMAQAQLPPGPDYLGAFREVPTGNPDLLQITAQDSPVASGTSNDATARIARDLTNIAVAYNFRVYLIWRFGTGADTVIYTLATRDWNAIFRADTFVAGQGVTAIAAGAGTFSLNPFDRTNHDDPIVVRPTFNESIGIR